MHDTTNTIGCKTRKNIWISSWIRNDYMAALLKKRGSNLAPPFRSILKLWQRERMEGRCVAESGSVVYSIGGRVDFIDSCTHDSEVLGVYTG